KMLFSDKSLILHLPVESRGTGMASFFSRIFWQTTPYVLILHVIWLIISARNNGFNNTYLQANTRATGQKINLSL
ncbi:hypothetical protein, partial [uncultured Muribaculum sp.]|uniref:hypothetical protein n=1 Tax=uncultured Muribaculum sp. TaxID=1918613 RepID=UPI00258313BA